MNKQETRTFYAVFADLSPDEQKQVAEATEDYNLIWKVLADLTQDEQRRKERAKSRAKALAVKIIQSRSKIAPKAVETPKEQKVANHNVHDIVEERLKDEYKHQSVCKTECKNFVCMKNYNGACGHSQCITGHRI